MMRISRAVLALAVMTLLVLGVPALLLQIDLTSTMDELLSSPADFLEHPLSDSALLALLALIGWLCWFVSLLAFVTEAWGVFRGRPVRELAALGMPQRCARVVAGWLFVGGVAIPASAPALQLLVPRDPVVLEFATVALSSSVATNTSAVRFSSEHVVLEGENLWEIAEDHLGDGLRWRELFALNEGNEQADGRCLQDPNLILVGWKLQLPLTGSAARDTEPSVSLSPAVAEVPERSSMSDQLDPELLWIEPLATTEAQQTPEESSQITLGELPVSASSSVGLILSAGSVVAAGAFVEAERRRRVRRRHFSTGLVPSPLDVRLGTLKNQLASQAADLPSGIARFWDSLRQRGVSVIAARVSEQSIRLLVSVDALFPPWTKNDDGWWEIARSDVLDDSDDPWPGLLLTVAESPELILVDLLGVNSLRVEASEQVLDVAVRCLLMQLRHAALGPSAEFVVVGNLRGLSETQDRGAESLASIAAELEARSGASQDTLVVVVSGDDPDLARVIELAARGGLALLVFGRGQVPCGLTLMFHGDVVEFSVTDQPARLVESSGFALTAEEVLAIRDLLDHYQTGGLTEGPLLEPSGHKSLAAAAADDFHLVQLQLLGEVAIAGLRTSLPPQQLAIFTYLFLHPGATSESIQDAVWGGVRPSSQRFKNVISNMRSTLGYELLPTAEAGRYRLGAVVACDLGRFEALTALGDTAETDDLAEALALVRGIPISISGTWVRHFGWVDIENLGSYWELQVLRVAIVLTERHLKDQEFELAISAARQGLRGCPLNEQLTRSLITAHLGAGQQRIAAEVAGELIRALEELGVDELEAETELLVASMGSKALLS